VHRLWLILLFVTACSAPPGPPGEDSGVEVDAGAEPDDAGSTLDGGDDAGVDAGTDGGSCTSESHAAFCARYSRACGAYSDVDNCGRFRLDDCGQCSFPNQCSDAGTCGCTPKSCTDVGRVCGEAYVGCGTYTNCGPCPDGGQPPPWPLRVTAANLTSGNLQSYDPGEGTRIFQGLRPDVVLIQEFNYGAKTDADIRRYVDQTFGPDFYVYREGGKTLPNGIISRYPIVASGSFTDAQVSNRGFAWARIDIPGPTDLWAFSLHLLTTSASLRQSEANALVSNIQGAVPAGDFIVLGGDLNTSTRTEACITSLAQVVSTTAPFPADQNGNGNTSASRGAPLDWVLVNTAFKAKQVPLVIGANSFSAGLVFDSRVYTPLADVAPVLSSDSAATGMQHMAVSKQFSLP
jgi:endonuclease/exonuclease/phosphatase family metal-dependent hydrolase